MTATPHATADRDGIRSRVITWRTPQLDTAEIGATSGLDYLQRLLDDPHALPIGALMDFRPVRFEPGLAVFEGTPSECHYNPIGAVHGGFAAAILDSALGCSVHTMLKPGQAYIRCSN
jgi:acyl-coenzyme A thioesterase PaaI-like protein